MASKTCSCEAVMVSPKEMPDSSFKCERCNLEIDAERIERLNLFWAANDNVEGDSSDREGGFRVSTVLLKSDNFPIVTSNYVPGKDIVDVLGLIFVSSNRRMGLTVTNLASNTFNDSINEMKDRAKKLGADAIISLTLTIERAGPSAIAFSQTVALMGTAVKLK